MTSSAISLPFSFNSNGGVAFATDPSKIFQDRVVLVVMTYIGERVLRLTFGTGVKATAFLNQQEAIEFINSEIVVGFNKFLPYLSLVSVDSFLDSNNLLNNTINYKYGNSGTTETVVVKTNVLDRSGNVITEVSYAR